jgi:hypothetical protein
MTGRGDTRCTVDVEAHVIVATDNALAAVKAHPHVDGSTLRPCRVLERTLTGDGGRDGRRCIAEDNEERITFGSLLLAVVFLER